MESLIIEGALVVNTEDVFQEGMENYDDCWIGRKRSSLMFTGCRENGSIISGGLELIIKDHFKELFIDNHPVGLKITIDAVQLKKKKSLKT